MAASKPIAGTVRFRVENVGGIDGTEVDIPLGVTVLTGKNATNRTSLLQAIMAAIGSDRATLKGDAEEGTVEAEFGDRTVVRTLARTGGSVQFSGEKYLDDPEVADLFAFLLETNEARQAVARGEDLRELIMRPVDVDAIRAEIDRLEGRKADINDELADIESRQRDLPTLEQRRNGLRERVEEKREALAAKEEAIDVSSRNVEQSRKEQDELEATLDELRSTRSDLESVRREIQNQQESIASLEEERDEYDAELEDLPETPMGDREQREEEIARLRSRRQELNTDISELQSLIGYNEERLDEGNYGVLDSLEDASDAAGGSVTDKLLDDEESVVCWTCGSTVEREQIEATVDRLKRLRSRKVDDLDEVKSELDDLKTAQREASRKQDRRDELERKLHDIDDELDRRDDRIESLKERRKELADQVESLEREAESLESEDFEEILSLHREANQFEFEIERLESNLEEVTAQIEAIETQIERAEDLREEREGLVEALADQRTKIDQIEAEAVESFNEHMDAVLDLLEYENLERIWIERVKRDVREERQTVERTVFELHIVRATENGTAYEDTVEHLSESEREVTGLIFALAGYLVHDLHESVPFMLLDSLEAIDADRIATLVEYFSEYADYLVVALLPEDARALDDSYNWVTEI